MKKIDRFVGEFRFLSNFCLVEVRLRDEGDRSRAYDTVEHAFQAAKTLDPHERDMIQGVATPGRAKRIGRALRLRPAWDDIKLNVMRDLLWYKFTEHPEFRARLLATEDAELVEGNTWGDVFWGVDLKTGRGENHLGKLLMETRDKIRKQELAVLYSKRVAPELDLFEDMLKRARIQYEKSVGKQDTELEIEGAGCCGAVCVTFDKNGQLMSIKVLGYGG